MIKLSKVNDKTEGGLFLSSTASETPKEGVVAAAGPGFTHPLSGRLIPNPLTVGLRVLLADFGGDKVEYNGDPHIFVDASCVLGWCDKEPLQGSNFIPALDNVLLKVEATAKETTSGIALALDEQQEGSNQVSRCLTCHLVTQPRCPPATFASALQGEVVAVGAGKFNSQGEAVPPGIAVGDKVVYARDGGVQTSIAGKKYVVVPASECLATW